MYVIKRSGRKESVKFDKVTARIEKLSYKLNPLVNPIDVAKKVIEGIYEGVPTTELDNLAAETAASLTTKHPDMVLFNESDATSWKPDIRELSPNQLYKKAKEAFSEAGKETDPQKKAVLLAQGQAFLIQMGTALQG